MDQIIFESNESFSKKCVEWGIKYSSGDENIILNGLLGVKSINVVFCKKNYATKYLFFRNPGDISCLSKLTSLHLEMCVLHNGMIFHDESECGKWADWITTGFLTNFPWIFVQPKITNIFFHEMSNKERELQIRFGCSYYLADYKTLS